MRLLILFSALALLDQCTPPPNVPDVVTPEASVVEDASAPADAAPIIDAQSEPEASFGDIYDQACIQLQKFECPEAQPGCAAAFRQAATDGRFIIKPATATCVLKATSKPAVQSCKGIVCK